MSIVFAAFAVLLLASCSSSTVTPGPPVPAQGRGLFESLAQVSEVRPDIPALVFVYTDG